MQNYFLRASLFFLLFSCSKGEKAEICYQGKYVGKGCWDVIQITPKETLPEASIWLKPLGGHKYEDIHNAIGVGNLPDSFKDGQPFYFNVAKVREHGVITTECGPTKYIAEIKNVSRNFCNYPVAK